MAMARRKTTVYLDEDVVRASRVLAARAGLQEYEIVNGALRTFLGLAAVERVWAGSQLTDEEAATLAYGELQAMRREAGGGTAGEGPPGRPRPRRARFRPPLPPRRSGSPLPPLARWRVRADGLPPSARRTGGGASRARGRGAGG